MSRQRHVACRYATFAEVLGDAGEGLQLSPRETREVSCFRHAPRAREYRGGRLLSKMAFGELAGFGRAERSRIEVLSRTEEGRPTRPRVSYRGRATGWSLSIAHHGESLLLAASLDSSRRVGVDLAPLDPALAAPLSHWSKQPRSLPASPGETEPVVRHWAIQEAVYKVCNQGEPFAPRRVQCEFSPGERTRLRYWDREITDCVELRTWIVDRCVAVVVVADLRLLRERFRECN